MDPDYHYGDQKSRQNPQNQVPDQFLRQMYKGRSIGPDDSQSMAAQYLPYTGARNGLSPQIYIEQGSYDSLQYNQALALAGAYSAEENVHLRAPSMALPIYAPSQSPFMNHVMDPASYYQYKNQKRTMSGEQQQYQFSGGGPSNFNGDHMANGGMYNGMACPDQPMYQLPPHEYPVKPGFATLESLGQTSEVSSKRAQRIGQLKKEIDMIDETERRYNTRGTCCCPSSKRDRTICISAIFLMLLTSGLFIFFYFPRIPDFNVLRVVTDSNAENSLSFTQDPRDKGKIDLSFTLFVDVSVINDNRYKLKIETLDLKVL